MLRKIRELIHGLEKLGFINRGGKGSHRNYKHSKGVHITISGALGNDAKSYQERELQKAIKEMLK